MRRGEITSEFGRAAFDKEFGAANANFSRSWVIQSALVLFKYYPRPITYFGKYIYKCI